MNDHTQCADVLRRMFAERDIDVTISLERPVVDRYELHEFTCPHGITYWPRPTDEQIAAWARDGVR